MARRYFIAGNWKLNKTIPEALEFAGELRRLVSQVRDCDIAIAPEASALKLGGLQRVATGAKGHWENDRVSVTVFAARTAQEQQIQEIRAQAPDEE